jgi:hypothetical protein
MRIRMTLLLVVFSLACDTDRAGLTAPIVHNASGAIKADGMKPHLFEGIRLSPQERSSIFAINRRYNEQIKGLRMHSSNPHGPVDNATLSKIHALRVRQFAEWEAVMSKENAAKFEDNRRLSANWWGEMKAKFHALQR